MLPWQEKDAAGEQRRFIEEWLEGKVRSFPDLCLRFGISRKSGYKRVSRFRERGLEGVGDLSRAPHRHPNATPRETVGLLLAGKKRRIFYGPRKILPVLRRAHPRLRLPSPSTAGRIFKAHGLVRSRRRKRGAAPWAGPAAGAVAPNDTWCADLKGWFRTGDGERCDPLTVPDDATRYLTASRGLARPRLAEVRPVFELAFYEYGLPLAIKTDNGPAFASTGLGGLTELSVWWVKLGIIPERIAPGRPEQNGRHERMHRTLKEHTASPPGSSLRAQQHAFDRFREEYNSLRPHEALGQIPPGDVYRPSEREYRSWAPDPGYRDGVAVRRVRTNGEIKWKGRLVYLSWALRKELVGLRQETDRTWAIYFGPLEIGIIDESSMKVIQTAVTVLPMSPV